jgi:homoserine dehydrogenase
MKKRIAFVGFGNVGKALAALLLRKKEELKSQYSIDYVITAIATRRHGMAINEKGLALEKLDQGCSLDELNTVQAISNTYDFIRKCKADILFENTPVNYETGQPALDYLRMGLNEGMHVITANKGPVVHGFQELTKLAKAKDKHFYFESTVMDGAPIFSLFRETLPVAKVVSFRGILNSTTNMILTQIESGKSFDEAVRYCQEIGIAETDPSGDIDGWDAAVKVAALSTVLMDLPIRPADIDREGIRQLTKEKIIQAKEDGKRWKLICYAGLKQDGLDMWVKPVLIGPDSLFYTVNGTTSMIEYETDVLGKLSVIEKDPGPDTTAYGLLADFINALKNN